MLKQVLAVFLQRLSPKLFFAHPVNIYVYFRYIPVPPEPITIPCDVKVTCCHEPVYLAGSRIFFDCSTQFQAVQIFMSIPYCISFLYEEKSLCLFEIVYHIISIINVDDAKIQFMWHFLLSLTFASWIVFANSSESLRYLMLTVYPLILIFISLGRYNKYSRELSQTPWLIEGVRKTHTSVQVMHIFSFSFSYDVQEIFFTYLGKTDFLTQHHFFNLVFVVFLLAGTHQRKARETIAKWR